MLWGAACGMTWADFLRKYEKVCVFVLNKIKAMHVLLFIRWHLDDFRLVFIKLALMSRAWIIGECLSLLGVMIEKLTPSCSLQVAFF